VVKVVEFPQDKSESEDVKEMLTKTIDHVEEQNVTQAVVVMMSEDGNIGVSASGSPFDVIGMLAMALKEL
jgi:hypothetical protein